MKRDKFLIPFSHDHHHGLAIARFLRKGAPVVEGNTLNEKAEAIIKFYYSDLLPHFEREEKSLFPRAKEIDEYRDEDCFVSRLINELIEEHKEIKNMVLEISEGQYDENSLDQLGELLQNHIRKEERQLFPELQGKIDPEYL